jgi:hypothetical protein
MPIPVLQFRRMTKLCKGTLLAFSDGFVDGESCLLKRHLAPRRYPSKPIHPQVRLYSGHANIPARVTAAPGSLCWPGLDYAYTDSRPQPKRRGSEFPDRRQLSGFRPCRHPETSLGLLFR